MTEKPFGADNSDAMQSTVTSDQQHTTGESVSDAEEQHVGIQDEQVVTVVFTAENHLGYAAPGQAPHKREEWQQRLRSAFQQATDFALGQGVDLFIQGGDLFDSATPHERDRDFVAARLAQLRQANVRVFALGGVHDTPADAHATAGEETPAPQLGYARLGALTYFAPNTFELEPVIIDIHGVPVGICGLGMLGMLSTLTGQSVDPLARMHVASEIERAAIPLLILHAPIEGLVTSSSSQDSQTLVSRESIERQTTFRTILAGYHRTHQQVHLGQCDVVVAGATQHVGFAHAGETPGFVFLGLDRNGIRWCKHIAVDALPLCNLVIRTDELWPSQVSTAQADATGAIIARLQPLCDGQTMVKLRLEGTLTRQQYHQLDLHRLRRFGEEHAFALAIDDSDLELLPEQEHAPASLSLPFNTNETRASVAIGERFSPREELIALADEWIAAAPDEQEQKALHATKEELLAAMDEIRSKP